MIWNLTICTRVRMRDQREPYLSMVFFKLSASVSSLIGGTLDPLHVTKLTGPIHVQVEQSIAKVYHLTGALYVMLRHQSLFMN